MSEVLRPTTGTGLCSCLTVRVHDAVEYYKQHGRYPEQIDSSGQFGIYKDYREHRIDKVLFDDYVYDAEQPYINFNHGWQYGWYNEVEIERLSKLALNLCPVSQAVGHKSYDMIQRMGSRTAVLYRGNDKVKEIPAAPYQAMIEMALATGDTSFVVQTDELEFYETFKNIFPDTIRFEEIGMMHRNYNSYYLPQKGNNTEFVVNFIAALRAIGHAEKFITITGNTGLWAMIFRGHFNNVWQFNGNFQTWKKL